MADGLTADVIKNNAESPAFATGDSGSIKQHNLKDQIAADKHLASKAAMSVAGVGLKFIKFKPGGTVSD